MIPDNLRILIVGQGGREHVLAWKMAQSPHVSKIFCAPGNAGTAQDVTNVDISSSDIKRLVKFAQDEKIDLAVIGPEAPLVAGLADEMQAVGVRVFGPSKAAAQLEGSKAFAKKIMRLAKVPTADYQAFDNLDAALTYIEDRTEIKLVVKADGLAAGKGVVVCDTQAEALDAVKSMLSGRQFGAASEKIIIEERLEGQEVSILAIVDGNTIIPLETSQDHKAAYDGDTGPNTGGMGAYSPAPIVTSDMMDEIIENILVPTIHTLRRQKAEFRGVLYAGLMITNQGPKVLEFNVRFGDPEAQPVLMRLKTDLAKVLYLAAEQRLGELDELEWDERPSLCVVMASEGYPGDYEKGKTITGLAAADEVEGAKVFHAGTALQGEKVVNDGGRVLGVTAIGADLTNAKLRAYQAVKQIRWEGAWCRKDISDKARN
ncbi:Phosphoribosylamine--glycine ligase [Polystyrenella longa]|uniref:Phosphoribosylamine--glycine ligase n=1 Tax=Polystyrenella longa TaxID=2528007 RepID=A0A518CPJ0_9PLAN|nr:phosphoribosylamine--glycine ligase [Polystyrenella longa]QDU81140.1 Phosphoribosylamine--glycine ligase [Polystyrenella longa]